MAVRRTRTAIRGVRPWALIFVLGLLASVWSDPHAEDDRPYRLPDPGGHEDDSEAKGLILHFDTWPPDSKEIEPLLRKLENAGLEPGRGLPLFKSLIFEWDEVQPGRRALNLCFELALDERVTSLFASCAPDYRLEPARSVHGNSSPQ